MAAIKTATNRVSQSAFWAFSLKRVSSLSFLTNSTNTTVSPQFITRGFRNHAATRYGDAANRALARLSQVQQYFLQSDESSSSVVNDLPKIRLEHVSVSFSKSGGNQFFAKEDSKIEMRFNLKNATWLSERVREKIKQMEKKRINKDGEIVIIAKVSRTQQANIILALKKLQEIINAAAYVPPPLTEEQKKTIAELVDKLEQQRLQNKKEASQKMAS